MLNSDKVNEIFSRFAAHQVDPKIELIYKSPYTLLVAVILSAQATDKKVNEVVPALFKIADTPHKMIELGEDGLKKMVSSIGLYNTKAKNIIAMSKLLVEKYNGEVPDSLESLESLPGVGRKSANVMLNTVFGHPTIAVDTHVFRVSNRIGLCKSSNPHQTEEALLKIIPTKWRKPAHHWLVLHGRYVCKAKKPECNKCIISDICQYDAKRLEVD
ncbi:endonuclease III [Rickettsiales endosymbiont of Peranema trichophorum]|uniref:endonuclease III n=1 Tax=Rickettsiales endosymbiont of Peranema trichophorum TaxID=2486577 RepID=UPI001023C144|nr:endonuclease III [Rickettsiales endosymbiont of Peranema trichophorum]RZI46977.1 endonuclease III [Rickettsiales endosymbiont of Peranema trichophorum]